MKDRLLTNLHLMRQEMQCGNAPTVELIELPSIPMFSPRTENATAAALLQLWVPIALRALNCSCVIDPEGMPRVATFPPHSPSHQILMSSDSMDVPKENVDVNYVGTLMPGKSPIQAMLHPFA